MRSQVAGTLRASRARTAAAAAIAAAVVCSAPGAAQTAGITTEMLEALRFRPIGPAVTGGRIHDVEALPHDPSTIWIAAATGGLWKSTNKGTTWTPVFDGQPVSAFGDVAIAPSDPDVVWAGTGEQNNRQSTSWGNGVYRSDDGGLTWRHLGLEETRHIGRVVVHPADPDRAWVAALGNLWRPSADRGVFRTDDGGTTWEKVLYVDTLTGAVDLVMDPTDPDVLYAAAYQRLRRPWGFNGGGPGSGIYKTTDGGRSWQRLSNGLPTGDIGRIGLAIAPTEPRVLVATVEHAAQGGIYRTGNGGRSWTRVSSFNVRPMYYSHVIIDPTEADRVYKLAVDFHRSDDGGRTWRTMPIRPTYDVGVHGDFHSLWIDPGDPRHLYLGGDGGLYESWDMGETFMRLNNLPIAQFYAIGADLREPYHVYGGLQDNHSWMGPSATRRWTGIIGDDWRQIGFGDGMYQQVAGSHQYIISNSQNGSYSRVDAGTGDRLDIAPRPPAGESDYRWDWTSPSLVSRHDSSVVYVGGNRLFVSRDRGITWERTVDLTRQVDRDTLSIMGVRGSEPMLSKNDGEASFSEIVTIAESPLDRNILWVGTDDGSVQVSRDGGRTWRDVSASVAAAEGSRVQAGTYVSRVIASAAAPGVAYVTLDAHRDGDFTPYLFRTADFGRSWTPLRSGLPPAGSANVIVEDPRNPSVLYLGTEHGLFFSADAGRSWIRFPALPATLYDDLLVHAREHDLIVATHGRGIWILDDARPLAEWTPQVAAAPAHLFSIRPATAFQYWKDTSYRGQSHWNGENPPHGAILTYHLRAGVPRPTLSVRNAAGLVVRRLEVDGSAGLHRVIWDLRHEPPFVEEGEAEQVNDALPAPLGPFGPFVAPGTYTVTLEAGAARSERTVEVRGDPLLPLTIAEHQEREAFLVDVAGLDRETAETRTRARQLEERVSGAAADSVRTLGTRLGRAGSALRRLAGDFNGSGVRQGSMYPPTPTHRELVERIRAELRDIAGSLERLERGG